MRIIQTPSPTALQKQAIFRLWNDEYPASISYSSINQLEGYLADLSGANHFFMVDDEEIIAGWAFTFMRDDEKWFAIIVDGKFQGKQIGTLLLRHLKENETELNGWVIEKDDYAKNNRSFYSSPIMFYLKNNFEILSEVKLENERMKAVKIHWKAK